MTALLSLLLAAADPSTDAVAPSPPAPATTTPVVIEYYYRVRWGGMDEFRKLYAKNHQPVLDEMKRLGFITRIETAVPYNHMVGEARWDLRVTITYRSAEDAVGDGTGYGAAAGKIMDRLYPDRAKFDAEEARRFALLDEHWDVIVNASE